MFGATEEIDFSGELIFFQHFTTDLPGGIAILFPQVAGKKIQEQKQTTK